MNTISNSFRRWTGKEIQFLKTNYAKNGSKYCANKLNKTIPAIRHKTSRMDFKIDKIEQFKRQAKTLMDRFDKSGKPIITIDSWKKRVLLKYKYICQDCFLYCPTIAVAHHIKERNIDQKLKYDVRNGICLCPNCHAKRHYKNGRKYSAKRITSQQKILINNLRKIGKSISQIATELGINEKSVNFYKK
jgi:Pyruvate/2-oxoacid:ferredoxin oxidoreductase delta subunit